MKQFLKIPELVGRRAGLESRQALTTGHVFTVNEVAELLHYCSLKKMDEEKLKCKKKNCKTTKTI